MEERAALEGALLQLAAFHWHTGSVERARGLAERAQRQSQQPTAAGTLLAWVILSSTAEDGPSGQQMDLREAEGLLAKALQQDPSNLEVGLGLRMNMWPCTTVCSPTASCRAAAVAVSLALVTRLPPGALWGPQLPLQTLPGQAQRLQRCSLCFWPSFGPRAILFLW